MSIIKNDTTSSTAMTIAKLGTGALASPPLPSGHALIGFTPKYYIACTSAYFRLGFYPRGGETVIIKASLPANASGTIYGVEGSSGRCIKAEGGYLKWYNGSTVVFQREIDEKVHNFGYQGYDDNGTPKSRPYYDKESLSSIEGSANGSTSQKAVIGASCAATPANVVSSITIYEVVASSYPSATDTTQYRFHYYAALHKTSPNNPCLMETRHDLVGVTHTGTSVTAGSFPSLGYGVQLHDLKDITGSGYTDLIALMAEDGGVDTDCGWSSQSALGFTEADPPCVMSKSGETDRNFAIYIGKGNTHIPIPSGWSVSQDATFLYELGDKIRGRKLKSDLSIWNDAIDFGFFVNSNNQFRFNIFKRMDDSTPTGASGAGSRIVTDGRFHLEWMNGYNTGNTLHPPVLSLEDNQLTLHIHNGAMLKCLSPDLMAGVPDAVWQENDEYNIPPHYVVDTDCVFLLNESVGGSLTYCLGNLVPWNRTLQQAENALFIPKGMRVVLNLGWEAHEADHDYFTTPISREPSPYLTKDASETVKTLYQSTGITNNAIVGTGRWLMLDYLTQHQDAALYARLVMIASVGNQAGDTLVDTSNLIPVKKCALSAAYNPSLATNAVSPRYRMVIDYHGASSSDKIGVVGPRGGASEKNHNRVFTRCSYYQDTSYTYVGLEDPFPKSEWNSMMTALNNHTATAKNSAGGTSWETPPTDDTQVSRKTWAWEWRVYQDSSTWKAQFCTVYRWVGTAISATQGYYHTFNAADYSNCYETWHDYYLHKVEGNETAIFVPFIGITESGNSFSPNYTAEDYVALIEAFWETDSGGEYGYRNFFCTSLEGPTGLADYKKTGSADGPYKPLVLQWWSDYTNPGYAHSVWYNGNAVTVASSNINNLATYTREFAIRKSDFGVVAANTLAYNMTIVSHIWPKTSAPVLFKLKNGTYSWNYTHHVMTVLLTGTISGQSASRTYVFAGTYWEGREPENGNGTTFYTQIRWKSYSYTSESGYTEDTTLGCYVKVSRNGTPLATLDFTSFNNYDLEWRSEEHVVTATGTDIIARMDNYSGLADNEMFYGLDGVYNNAVFGLYLSVSNCNAGDNIEVEFTNSAS